MEFFVSRGQGIKFTIFAINCLVQGATILPGWEFVWLGFDVSEVFPDSLAWPV